MEQQKNSPLNDPHTHQDSPPYIEVAKHWHSRHLNVIPVDRNLRPTVEQAPWLEALSLQQIEAHWAKRPDDLVACILPSDLAQVITHDDESERGFQNVVGQYCLDDTASMEMGNVGLHLYRLKFGTVLKGKDLGAESGGCIEIKMAGSLAFLSRAPSPLLRRLQLHMQWPVPPSPNPTLWSATPCATATPSWRAKLLKKTRC